jgi:hypothetical protein
MSDPVIGNVTAVSSGVVTEASSATGGSFAGVTVIDTDAVSVPPLPSETVYSNASGPK